MERRKNARLNDEVGQGKVDGVLSYSSAFVMVDIL